jgi:hypothetical protein
MVNIEAITIKDDKWTPVPQNAGIDSLNWTDGRDMLILRHFPIPPDIPAPLSRLDLIWKISRLESFWRQTAPVDIYTGEIGGNEYLGQIFKFSFNGRTGYQGSLIIPKASFSLMFIVSIKGSAADEEREIHVEKSVLGNVTDLDEKARCWFVDPFSFGFVTPFGRNRSDDEEWDEMYPSHPLSRIRTILRELPTACEISPDVARAPAFVGPTPTSKTEQELAEYAKMFTVTAAEQAELDALSRGLGKKIESVVTESGLNSSTETLFAEEPVYAKSDPRNFLAQFENRAPSASHKFANAIAELVSEQEEPKLCLVIYSSKRDSTFYHSISLDSEEDAEVLASAEALQWEFIVSRLLKTVNVRCVSVRSLYQDKCRTGVALITANETDWFAKFITLCEMYSMIVCATMLNQNLAKEHGVVFGLERNRAKFLYRSSDAKFHLGNEQEYAFDDRQLPEVWGYLLAKKMGISVSIAGAKQGNHHIFSSFDE